MDTSQRNSPADKSTTQCLDLNIEAHTIRHFSPPELTNELLEELDVSREQFEKIINSLENRLVTQNDQLFSEVGGDPANRNFELPALTDELLKEPGLSYEQQFAEIERSLWKKLFLLEKKRILEKKAEEISEYAARFKARLSALVSDLSANTCSSLLPAKDLEMMPIGTISDWQNGPFRVARLAEVVRSRLKPSQGLRPGRPSDESWVHRPKVPMTQETVDKLTILADEISTADRKVTPMQVAGQLLEQALVVYFGDGTEKLRE